MKEKQIAIELEPIEIPSKSQEEGKKVGVLRKLIKTIEDQLKEISEIQNQGINIKNIKKVEEILIVVNSLIEDCHMAKEFNCTKNQKFIMLIYEHQRLSLQYETYKLKETIDKMDEKTKELKREQEKLDMQYKKTEERNNNLIYNLLGFLTSFSIVSASVAAIDRIEETINILLFISFIILILLTTLIALHNFYKNDNKKNTKLQDNYFLWKLVLVITIILVIVLGGNEIIKNKDIFNSYIDSRVEKVIEEKKN